MAIDANEQIEKFREFIETNYQKQLNTAIRTGRKFLLINFQDLAKFDPGLSEEILEEPEETLKAAELSLEQLNISEDVHIRIRFNNLPKSQEMMIRDIRSMNIGKFLFLLGIVRQSSDVRPQVVSAKFECPACGNTLSILQLDTKFKEPTRCSCGRRGHFRLLSKDLVDAQRLVIEEAPESLTGGEQPKRISIFLKEDLVEPKMEKKTTPGSKVKITGIVKEVPIILKTGVQSIRYDLMMEANYIEPIEESYEEIEISEKDKEEIMKLSKDPNVFERLVKSIAPSIYGHEDIKEALILQLMGGVKKEKRDGTVIRGDIHVLLVGDPGASKSTLLMYMSKAAPKARYISGKGASLDYTEPLLIRKNGIIQTLPIGKFVDSNYISDCENIMVPLIEPVEALVFDKETYAIKWKPIKYIYRHRTEEPLFKFTAETGRQISVTGDHSIFILQDGKPDIKPARELIVGDCILIPRSIPQIPQFNISIEAARLLGYYIAEGHTVCKDGSYKIEFTLNKNEKNIINDIKKCALAVLSSPARLYKHGKNGIRLTIYGKSAYMILAFLLGDIIGKKAKEKSIPLCIINAQPEARHAFIKSYLAGDAGVTKSKDLMSNLLYLFSQDGIIASVNQRKDNKQILFGKRIITPTGDRYDLKSPKDNRIYEARYIKPPFTSLPKTILNLFFKGAISSEYKRASLLYIGNKTLFERLKFLDSKIVCGREFRKLFGECSLEYINDHTNLFKKIKNGREVLLTLSKKGKEIISNLYRIKKLVESDLGFVRIKKIERVKATTNFVYDISIPDYENFVGGFGGIICHNSGAGLTASVVKDEFLRGWALEAGALVLCNSGLACIDELDKMSPEDRSAMHEALEQQRVTISKANIQATLKAETTVLAAANPKLGRFDPYSPIAGQIELPPTLINRFDLIFPIRDIPSREMDEKIASHVLSLQQNPDLIEPEVPIDLFKKYIAYAKQNIKPKLTDPALEEIKTFYINLRNTTTTISGGEEALKPIPISARQLEALVRLAEGSARVRLSRTVTKRDAQRAINLLRSCLMQVGFDYETGQIDIDRISTGIPTSERSKIITVRNIINEMHAKGRKTIPIEDIISEASAKDISEADVEEIIERLKREGSLFEPHRGSVSLI